ncbi:MAG: adenylate kinase [Eubacteriaceae bacterium]|nr:adenylate kinase [Eubacteriaceae bacterium]
MKIIILGPPGAGKGTQATQIAARYDVPHISTGDIFRKNLREETPLGLEAKTYMDNGLLVPDSLTVGMLKDRISEEDCRHGYLLDGFPRTLAQADALVGLGEQIDAAINLQVDYAPLIERIAGRRVCGNCGSAYHIITAPPKVENVCDNCGTELYQRDDDKAETVEKRLVEYDEKSKPLVAYYENNGLAKHVDASAPIEDVTNQIFSILDKLA